MIAVGQGFSPAKISKPEGLPYKLLIAFGIVAVPPFFADGTAVRITAAVIFYAAGFFAVYRLVKQHIMGLTAMHMEDEKQHLVEMETLVKPMRAFLSGKSQIIPVLTNQLTDVTQQTEAAALEIGGKFMNIVQRARNQAKKASGALAAAAMTTFWI